MGVLPVESQGFPSLDAVLDNCVGLLTFLHGRQIFRYNSKENLLSQKPTILL